MKLKQFSEEQIIRILKEAEAARVFNIASAELWAVHKTAFACLTIPDC